MAEKQQGFNPLDSEYIEEMAQDIAQRAQDFYANLPPRWKIWRRRKFKLSKLGHIDYGFSGIWQESGEKIMSRCQELLPENGKQWSIKMHESMSMPEVCCLTIHYK